MNKPCVFISHITEEAELAELLKTQITQDFLGMIDVFVSSDETSIAVGSKWLDDISAALETSKVELILCSLDSVTRPWVNFEAGAAWVKGIPIVPICHTGLRPVDLPLPLNMLQGIIASDVAGLERVYGLLAQQLGCAKPKQAFANLVASVQNFEVRYGVIRFLRHHVQSLITLLPGLRKLFEPGATQTLASGQVQDILLDKMRAHLDALQSKGYVTYSSGATALLFGGSGGGVQFALRLEIQPIYKPYAAHVLADTV